MKTADFLHKYDTYKAFLHRYYTYEELATWALSISDDMADVWNALIKEGKHEW